MPFEAMSSHTGDIARLQRSQACKDANLIACDASKRKFSLNMQKRI